MSAMGKIAYLDHEREKDGETLRCETCQHITQHNSPDSPVGEGLDKVSPSKLVIILGMSD